MLPIATESMPSNETPRCARSDLCTAATASSFDHPVGAGEHGLRKSAGVRLAEAGASVQQIMTVLGHRSPKMALYYCAQASKRELSDEAMKLWERAA